MRGLFMSLLSGFLAACASLCGKFSMTTDEPLAFCETVLGYVYPNNIMQYFASFGSNYDYNLLNSRILQSEQRQMCLNLKVLVIVRVFFFCLMVACNAVMWVSFTKALILSPTTISATLVNTAANFFFSAVFGVLLFGERPGWLWWLGTILIASGLYVMHSQKTAPSRTAYKKEKHSETKQFLSLFFLKTKNRQNVDTK